MKHTPSNFIFLLLIIGCDMGSTDSIYRENLQRTGVSIEDPIGDNPNVSLLSDWLWTQEQMASPVISGGSIISGGLTISKLKATDGELKWSKNAPGRFVTGTPIISGKQIFFLSGQSYLSAFRLKDGEKLWSTKVAPVWQVISPLVVDGRVIISTSESTVLAFDQDDGRLLWRHALDGKSYTSASYNNNIVYVGSMAGAYALNVGDGSEVWHTPNYHIVTIIVYSDNHLYYGIGEGDIIALDASNGELLWKYNTGSEISSSLAVDQTSIYVGNAGGKLVSIEKQTGSLQWSYDVDTLIRSSSTVAGDVIYFGDMNGVVHALDKYSGQKIWTVDVGGPIRVSPTLSKDGLIVYTDEGDLYRLK
ncbi:MAG: PQQ-binding-like beta-propeller repeat protein [Candidatus Marinimicrobia bacterium]|nr:PQQ-binding-like beta-propeller repeat protein [Candidatus Neomarinimicrobiota bacterium]